MLSFHLRFDLPSGLFLLGFSADVFYAFVRYPMRASCFPHLNNNNNNNKKKNNNIGTHILSTLFLLKLESC
jgi:hypothetical protein